MADLRQISQIHTDFREDSLDADYADFADEYRFKEKTRRRNANGLDYERSET